MRLWNNRRGQQEYVPMFLTMVVTAIVGVFVVAEVNQKIENINPEELDATCAAVTTECGTASPSLLTVFVVTLVLSLVIGMLVSVPRGLDGSEDGPPSPEYPPEREQYVRGEITLEEYEQRVWVWLIAEDSPPVERWPAPPAEGSA